MTEPKRAIRIANASGFLGDRADGIQRMVEDGPVDVVTSDYLAEVTMMILGKAKAKDPSAGYAAAFLAHLAPVFARVLEQKIKIVVNAGGLNPRGLVTATKKLAAELALSSRIACIEGDDLVPSLEVHRSRNAGFPSLESGAPLPTTPSFVHTANAYLGAFGIARALEEGADIVICPRVTDASLAMGPAIWWHGWGREDHDRLAGALVAGHVIECGAQATGGNYSSFRTAGIAAMPGFPIAEVAADGSSVITKHAVHPGLVTVGTVTAQLLYEVGSPRYLNPDVVAHLETTVLTQLGPDRVELAHTRGSAPPPTTKVAITCRGPHRNELTFAFVGLDLDEKIALFQQQARQALHGRALELAFQRIGAARPDADDQNAATLFVRVVATSEDPSLVGKTFTTALVGQAVSSYPGLFLTDVPGPATQLAGYWPTTVAQTDLRHTVVLDDGRMIAIEPPAVTATMHPVVAPSVAPAAPEPAVRGPLGLLVDARSGDKGSDANLGLWVRHPRAFPWLVETLTVEALRRLLPEAAALPIERYVLPNLLGLNFVVRGLLQGGATSTNRFDRQAKALGEFVRSRTMELPSSLVS